MSRIEEALKRASVASVPRNVYPLKDSRSTLSEPTTLADYPEERRGVDPSGTPRMDVSARRSSPADAKAQITAPTASHLGPFPDDLEGKLILSHATPVAVEQYRRLAATLHELQAAHGTKVVMVTSSVPREGKTLTVSNLAMTLSESYGRRVLLIDADLRRPSIHEIFQLPNATGLSDGLRSVTQELSLSQLSAKLSVLTAGRPDSNPMAGLTSERMRLLLDEASQVFDWVLLDAPPVGIMPDANLLARHTQGVIFVVAAGTTPYPLVERAISEIGKEIVIGVVLNRMDAERMPETDYYQDYHQADPLR
jgi:capsular exopolysaccharide synthesis family protein